MTAIGTPHAKSATKLLLLGAGELGKEVAIEAQRLGLEVIAVDRYANAPAMQIAHRHYVISMLDEDALREIIVNENPDFIVPEIEAIATHTLVELENEGYRVVPTAKATQLTMNREGIRRLVAETLGLPTSPYRFAESFEAYREAIAEIHLPCVVKPVMSSSGKGQSIVRHESEIEAAWQVAQTSGRVKNSTVIVEGFIAFDYEITLLTVRHIDGVSFCTPIGHRQVNGDYHESWQPHAMSALALERAEYIAKTVTEALGGYGVFGVEFFICGDDVYFSEVSPRPHDTGLVTLASQDLSQFALHVRAILGLPIPTIKQYRAAASYALLGQGNSSNMTYQSIEKALIEPETYLRLFGKPDINGERRLGVVLATADDVHTARQKTQKAVSAIDIVY